MKILRELSKSEVFFYQYHQWFSAYLTPFVRVRVKGELNNLKFQAALDQVTNKHPLLCACIKAMGGKYFFCQDENKAVAKAIFINKTHEEQWTTIAYKAVRKKIDVRTGPLFKIFVLKSAVEECHDIVIVTHHSVTDQKSFFIFFNDLLAVYDGEDIAQQGQIVSLSNKKSHAILKKNQISSIAKLEKFFPEPIKTTVLKLIFLKFKNAMTSIFFTKNNKKFKPVIHTFLFDDRQTEAILSSCRKHHVNLFGFVAAIFLTCIGKYSKRPFYSSVPVNLGNSSVNLGCRVSIFNKLRYFHQEKTNIWRLASYYHKFMKNLLKHFDPQVFIPRIPSNKFFNRLYFYLLKIKIYLSEFFFKDEIGVSMINVGFKSFSLHSKNLIIESINGSANSFRDRRKQFYIGAIVLNGKLNVTLSFNMDVSESSELKYNIISAFQELSLFTE